MSDTKSAALTLRRSGKSALSAFASAPQRCWHGKNSEDQNLPQMIMKIAKGRLAKLLGTFFAILLLSVSAFCQSGPPAPPPDPTLGAYYFEGSPWYSWDGDLPINYSTNLVSFPLWSRNALLLDTTNEV